MHTLQIFQSPIYTTDCKLHILHIAYTNLYTDKNNSY